MKVAFTIGAIIATFALPSTAQDITSLPQCAQQPILQAISASDCPLTDIACICANEGFVNGLVELIPTVCTPNEVEAVIDFATTLCSAYNVNLDIPTVSAPSGTSSIPPTATVISSESVEATASTTLSSIVTSSTLSESAEDAASTTPTSSTDTGATETSASTSTSSGPAQQTENAAVAGAIASPAFLGALAIGVLAAI